MPLVAHQAWVKDSTTKSSLAHRTISLGPAIRTISLYRGIRKNLTAFIIVGFLLLSAMSIFMVAAHHFGIVEARQVLFWITLGTFLGFAALMTIGALFETGHLLPYFTMVYLTMPVIAAFCILRAARTEQTALIYFYILLLSMPFFPLIPLCLRSVLLTALLRSPNNALMLRRYISAQTAMASTRTRLRSLWGKTDRDGRRRLVVWILTSLVGTVLFLAPILVYLALIAFDIHHTVHSVLLLGPNRGATAVTGLASAVLSAPILMPDRAPGQLVVVASCLLLWLPGSQLLLRARRMRAAAWSELRRFDERPPVLLFRAFADDDLRVKSRWAWRRFVVANPVFRGGYRFEQVLAETLAPVGPLVTIGEPNEGLPRLGAAREYLPAGNWQSAVRQLIEEAQLVFVILHPSSNVVWELGQTLTVLSRSRCLMLVPPVSDRKITSRWSEFRGALAPSTIDATLPSGLPYGAIAIGLGEASMVTWTAPRKNQLPYETLLLQTLAFQAGIATADIRHFGPILRRIVGRLVAVVLSLGVIRGFLELSSTFPRQGEREEVVENMKKNLSKMPFIRQIIDDELVEEMLDDFILQSLRPMGYERQERSPLMQQRLAEAERRLAGAPAPRVRAIWRAEAALLAEATREDARRCQRALVAGSYFALAKVAPRVFESFMLAKERAYLAADPTSSAARSPIDNEIRGRVYSSPYRLEDREIDMIAKPTTDHDAVALCRAFARFAANAAALPTRASASLYRYFFEGADGSSWRE